MAKRKHIKNEKIPNVLLGTDAAEYRDQPAKESAAKEMMGGINAVESKDTEADESLHVSQKSRPETTPAVDLPAPPPMDTVKETSSAIKNAATDESEPAEDAAAEDACASPRNMCSNIMYDETRAHRIYAGADALLVPSQFEPCGLTQLIAMHYGTIPIVRETGGLKDTVEPYNMYSNWGNGFSFDRYDAGLLLDTVNKAKALYFEHRCCWDEMVKRDMDKNLSWENSAKQYRGLYLDLTR